MQRHLAPLLEGHLPMTVRTAAGIALGLILSLAHATPAQSDIYSDTLLAVFEAHQESLAADHDTHSGTEAVGANGGAQADPLLYQSGGSVGCLMVNSDVGNERWAISWCQPGVVVSGNVFRTNGLPAFLWCAVTDVIGTVPTGSLVITCFGADRCPPNNQNGGTCSADQWSPLGAITLPLRFFLP
jgi:hypothetical protein